jgi:hypothetical protein
MVTRMILVITASVLRQSVKHPLTWLRDLLAEGSLDAHERIDQNSRDRDVEDGSRSEPPNNRDGDLRKIIRICASSVNTVRTSGTELRRPILWNSTEELAGC